MNIDKICEQLTIDEKSGFWAVLVTGILMTVMENPLYYDDRRTTWDSKTGAGKGWGY